MVANNGSYRSCICCSTMLGLFILFAVASSQARTVFYPAKSQMPPGRVIHMDAEDLDDWSASFSGSYSSNADLENKFRIKKIFNGARKIAKIGAALGYGAEDLDDWSASFSGSVSSNADDVSNRGINWGEITKIAGQVNQIGKVFGFDAEDLDDWSASFSGSYSSNNDLENKFRIKKIFNGARKIAKIGAALGYDADDLSNCRGPHGWTGRSFRRSLHQ